MLCFGIFGPLAPTLFITNRDRTHDLRGLFWFSQLAIGLRYFESKIPLVLSTLAAGAAIGDGGR